MGFDCAATPEDVPMHPISLALWLATTLASSTSSPAFLPTAPKPNPAPVPASELVVHDRLSTEQLAAELSDTVTAFAKDWIGKAADNICGLRDVAQVSNPATVDWQACLDATPEMKKVKDNKVGLDTPEGIKLSNAATNRVTDACEATRTANGYCSVWKTIKHKDGRTLPDITSLVKAQY
jgi:hypothetical protein